jgi:gliding motility-associated-like protein
MKVFKRCLITSLIFLLGNIEFSLAQTIDSPTGKISTINANWQPGGIFNGKQPQQEILSARTEYTKKFDIGNGLVHIYFGGPFHYLDKFGAWQDINLEIRRQTDPSFKYVNEENDFTSSFAEAAGGGVRMEYKKTPIDFGLNTKIRAGNWTPPADLSQNVLLQNNSITYKNIYDNIDLAYELNTGEIFHKIEFINHNVFTSLVSNQGDLTIEEIIQLPSNIILSDENGIINTDRNIKGNVSLIVNRDTVYTIQAAHIWDGAFVGNLNELRQSSEILESFRPVQLAVNFLSANTIKLIASIPVSWLKSPNRVFPITFDPTVNIGHVTSFGTTYRYPFNTCRQQRIDQILFLKSDINAGGINTTGNITNIEFFQGTPNPISNNNVQVKMLEVPWNVMTTETFTSGLTTVHNSSNENYTSGSNVWRSLPVNSFPYTNTGNLLIEVSFSNSSFTNGCSCSTIGPGGLWGYFNAPYYGHRWMYSMSSAPPPSGSTCNYVNSPEGNPAYGDLIPATRITINTNSGCAPISITANPSSQSIVAPAQAQFSVTVSGTTPAYQWEISTNGGASWANVPGGAPYSGSTTSQLTINPTSSGMNGYQYRCKITNSCTNPSPVTSGTGVLTVNAAGCSTVLTPTSSPNIPAAGGGGTFGINVTPNTCSWSVSASQTWIHITGALSGIGDIASKAYTVDPNTGGPRTGQIIVNGQTYTVNQLGVAAPTSYTISGKVTKQDGSPLANVIITATPSTPGSPTTTDAQGLYTLTVPLNYTGSLKPTLAPYTFNPLARTVNATNNSNINFQAIGAVIKILPTSTIAPWQREGDDYGGTINVQVGNTTTLSWFLEADVYNASNVQIGFVQFPTTSLNSFTFNTSQSQQLKNLSINGRRVEYVAIFDADRTIRDTIKSTVIIEKKWDNENFVLYNSLGQELKIPIKYELGATKYEIGIQRVPLHSTSTINLHPTGLSGCLLGNDFCDTYINSDGYLHIKVGGNNNLKSISPGEFKYTLAHFNNSNQQVGIAEIVDFDLTKIGYVNSILGGSNIDYNKVVVIIGGINNDIESDIFGLANASNQTHSSWSIANDLVFGHHAPGGIKNYNTWYIATCNLNSIQKNAYDIGVSLKRILSIVQQLPFNATNPNLNIIAHSRGGLETRIMLDGYGIPNGGQESFALVQNYFNESQVSGLISSLVFIGSPHQGAQSAAHEEHCYPGNGSALGATDLIPNSRVVNHLLSGTHISNSNMRIGSITGYGEWAGFNWYGDDGLVKLESSAYPNIINFQPYQYYVQDAISLVEQKNGFALCNYIPFHSYLHRSVTLNDPQNTCIKKIHTSNPPFFTYVNGNLSVMDRIVAIINNSNMAPSCSAPEEIQFSGATFASILPNAEISLYDTNHLYTPIGRTDENGIANLTFFDFIPYNDTILVKAPGTENVKLVIDSNIIRNRAFRIATFHKTKANELSNTSVMSLNQAVVSSMQFIQLKLVAENANQYLINSPLNQDSIFVPVSLNSSNICSILLDVGLNTLHIKFIGISDTVEIKKYFIYLPDSLLSFYSGVLKIQGDFTIIGAKSYVDNIFYKKISGQTDTLRILKGIHDIKFNNFGYNDLTYHIDSIRPINIHLTPISYSSLYDSVILNFSTGLNPQYWKTITVKSLTASNNKYLSIKQYDDPFAGMALIPQSRKFVFRKLYANAPALFKTAIVLDQVNSPSKDSVYLLTKKGELWVKYKANQSGVTEYDPEIQKIEFDKLLFDNNATQEIVLMKKQAPIMKGLDTTWHSGETIGFPTSVFVTDPDSIKNDLQISSFDTKVSITGNMVYITAPVNFIGNISFSLVGTHDFLDIRKTYLMKVIPPEVYVPNAFTPNNDGLNDVIRPIFLGKLQKCHFEIYNRNGQKIYETADCSGGWNGRINGAEQEPGAYIYFLNYQFEGEAEKQKKGSFILVK